jgi:hypothetical protein
MSIRVPPVLASLCREHGVELQGLSDSEIASRLPRVIQIVAKQQQENRVLLAKSALEFQTAASHCPNPGIERDEVMRDSFHDAPADANDTLNSLFPW